MKTALLLSGLPRHVDAGFPSIRDALMAPNNPDVFIHTWGDPNDHGLRSKLVNLFQPKRILIEPQKTIYNDYMNLDRMMVSHGRGYTRPRFVDMVYSMWYSIMQCNSLKELYRLEANIHYDCVIRARFDITYTIAINVANYDLNILWTADRPDLPPEMVDDRFGFSSNANMNIYGGGFNLIEYIWNMRDKKDGIICGETLCFEMCNIFGLTSKRIPGLHANHIR